MGSSAPKSETVVKGGKPVIVREYLSPEYLNKLTGLADFYQKRARLAASTRQENVNRYLGEYGMAPVYDPYTTGSGDVIEPYRAPEIKDLSGLVKSAEESGMFKPPVMDKPKKKKDSREAYSDALGLTSAGSKPLTDLDR